LLLDPALVIPSDASAGSFTYASAGAGTNTTAGAGTNTTAGAGTNTTAGAGTDTTATAGTTATVDITTVTGSAVATGTAVTELPYVLKMIWEAKGQNAPQAGAMKKYTLDSVLPRISADQADQGSEQSSGQGSSQASAKKSARNSLRYVFAPNGLTYLEIMGDTYCWRLLK
jgi:hypothetical protein